MKRNRDSIRVPKMHATLYRVDAIGVFDPDVQCIRTVGQTHGYIHDFRRASTLEMARTPSDEIACDVSVETCPIHIETRDRRDVIVDAKVDLMLARTQRRERCETCDDTCHEQQRQETPASGRRRSSRFDVVGRRIGGRLVLAGHRLSLLKRMPTSVKFSGREVNRGRAPSAGLPKGFVDTERLTRLFSGAIALCECERRGP
jgi:hypothetical protein